MNWEQLKKTAEEVKARMTHLTGAELKLAQRAQAISFVYGNCRLSNPEVTLEMCELLYDEHEAKKHFHDHLTIVENYLRRGTGVHAFRSGGGLRVVRIEGPDRGDLVGYGEHIHVEGAIRIAAQDAVAGNRPYDEVYGKTEPHYLTGAERPSSMLDDWILRGHTFDLHYDSEADEYVAEFEGTEHVDAPKEAREKAKRGETAQWSTRGRTYQTTACVFPNGDKGTTSTVINRLPHQEHRDDWIYTAVRTGRALRLRDALEVGLKAEPVEAK